MNNNHLESLRHSAAHLLAAAVMEIWPDTKRTIGPAIENGFYYDFEFTQPVSEKDFARIEQKMHEIAKTWHSFERSEVTNDDAIEDWKDNPYKLELVKELIDKNEKITYFKSGNFIDLCRGGHIEKPNDTLKHFKLLSVAGAYWRGDEKNPMLTRIYGTIFPTKEELEQYLWMLEEAKKRDHKKLGKELDLFVFSDLVGPGLPLWTPKGTLLRTMLDDYVWSLRKERGYEKVTIPHITKKELYETSGHWSKFASELFNITTREGHHFAMKPMNCPHHTQIYARAPRSYREMPQRYCETTMCYRDEQSGELSGLSRLRSFTQDDAHVFCRQSQIKEEFLKIWDIVNIFYSTFGFDLKVRLSLHDPDNMKAYLGTEQMWLMAENAIREIAKERKADYFEAKGEAAFYGPKIDFMAKDSLGRDWQVATIQLDINMPERFNLTCVNEEGKEERIVMIHAAIMGSIERFLSILIEHLAGNFPLWLSPVQVKIIPISEKHNDYAYKLKSELKDFRVEVDDRPERMQKKIRAAQLEKNYFMLVIGDKEIESNTVNIRKRNGDQLGTKTVAEFISLANDQIEKKKQD